MQGHATNANAVNQRRFRQRARAGLRVFGLELREDQVARWLVATGKLREEDLGDFRLMEQKLTKVISDQMTRELRQMRLIA
jgi:hypothetical protein